MTDQGGSLGPQVRALLDAARDGLSPDAAAVRRVRARIHLAAGGAAGTAVGIKLGLLAIAVAVAAGVGVARHRRGPVAVVPDVELASPPERAVQVVAREAPAPSDEALITIEPRAAPPPRARAEPSEGHPARLAQATTPATPRPVGGPGSRRPGTAVPGPGAVVVGSIDLAREVELLDRAMAALRRGDPGEALQAVQQHAAETAGRGQLAEDAAAIEIEALCRLHDDGARARLEAFDARFPRSAQRSRLSSRCP